VRRNGDRLPFAIPLPAEAPGSMEGRERVEWQVGLTVGRTRRATTIVIPVAGRAPQGLEIPLSLPAPSQDADAAEALAHAAGIGVERSQQRVTYDCHGYRPATLYLLFTLAMAAFYIGFSQLPALMARYSQRPMAEFFLTVWPALTLIFGGLLIRAHLRLVLLRVRATVDADGIEIRSGWLVAWRRRFIQASEIHGIIRTRTGNFGMVAFWDHRRFHQLFIDHGQPGMISDASGRGRLTRCAWMIPDLLTAQAIQADLERALGLAQRRAEAGREAAGAGRSAP